MSIDWDELKGDMESSIQSVVENHMKNQPYSAKCSECGEDLDITKDIDGDYDLIIHVTPCENCTNNNG